MSMKKKLLLTVVVLATALAAQAKVLTGEVTTTQIAAVTDDVLDLSGATLAADVTLSTINNDHIEYLALPMGMQKAEVQAIAFEGFTALKSAASLTLLDDGMYRLVGYLQTAGSLNDLMRNTSLGNIAGRASQWDYAMDKIEEVVLAGNICARDIAIRLQGISVPEDNWAYYSGGIGQDGHYYLKGVSPSLTDMQFGLRSAKVKVLDMEHATFGKDHNGDMVPYLLGYDQDGLQTVVLPTAADMTVIPAHALRGLHKLTEICIPHNYEEIGDHAFDETKSLAHIYTTPKLPAGAVYNPKTYDHGPYTWTFSPYLKKIGSQAFNLMDDIVTDLYVLAPQAPLCAKDAFSKGMTYGWDSNGYNISKHPFCRDTYQNATTETNSKVYCILHYPTQADADNRARYTDTTRVYSFRDETGVLDGDGNPVYWPNRDEFMRAYDQGSNGFTWEAYDQARVDDESWGNYRNFKNEKLVSKDGQNCDVVVDRTKTFDMDYSGWHQFVLTMPDYFDLGSVLGAQRLRYEQGGWYSICLPYDIRRSQLTKYYGNPSRKICPDIVTLVKVTRNEQDNTITLRFSKDLSTQDVNIDEDTHLVQYGADGNPVYTPYTDDDPVVLHRGRPYLIKPWFKKGAPKVFNAQKKRELAVAAKCDNAECTYKNMLKYNLHYKWLVKTEDSQGNTVEDSNDPTGCFTYQFLGVYTDGHQIPKWGYFMASSKFWWLNADNVVAWTPYTAVVMAHPSVTFLNEDCPKPVVMVFEGADDYFTDPVTGAKRKGDNIFDFSYTDTATGIEAIRPTVDGRVVATRQGKVYDLQGRYVGDTTDRLAHGLYIVNGRKMLVK